MALVNGHLVSVSIAPVQESPVPIVLPQVQVHVQGQSIAVDVQAHIFQKPTSLNNASAPEKSDDNKPSEIAGLPSVQITAQQASNLKKHQAPQTQTQSNGKVNTAAANAKEDDGCGFCAAIKQLFGLGKDIESGNDNQTKNDNTSSGNQSLGGAAIKVAIQSMNPTTNAASQGKQFQLPSQDPNNAAISSNPNNSTALPSVNDQYAGQGVRESNVTTTIVPVAAQPDISGATVPPNMIYIVSDPGQIQQQDMNSVQPQPNTTGYAETMPGYDSGQANNQTSEGVLSENNMGEEGQGNLDEYGYDDDNNYDDDDEVDAGF